MNLSISNVLTPYISMLSRVAKPADGYLSTSAAFFSPLNKQCRCRGFTKQWPHLTLAQIDGQTRSKIPMSVHMLQFDAEQCRGADAETLKLEPVSMQFRSPKL
jgi:hypothetical protein